MICELCDRPIGRHRPYRIVGMPHGWAVVHPACSTVPTLYIMLDPEEDLIDELSHVLAIPAWRPYLDLDVSQIRQLLLDDHPRTSDPKPW